MLFDVGFSKLLLFNVVCGAQSQASSKFGKMVHLPYELTLVTGDFHKLWVNLHEIHMYKCEITMSFWFAKPHSLRLSLLSGHQLCSSAAGLDYRALWSISKDTTTGMLTLCREQFGHSMQVLAASKMLCSFVSRSCPNWYLNTQCHASDFGTSQIVTLLKREHYT